MTVVTSYPGVYVEEIASLSMSISTNATAIPVFAVKDTDQNFVITQQVVSWLDFLSKVGAFDPTNTLHVSLKTYFENGGGYCYVAQVQNLLRDVPKYDDITLLVAAGEDISAAVATLCTVGSSLFAIVDGPSGELQASYVSPYGPTPFAAAYYPWLTAGWASSVDTTGTTVYTDIPPSAAVAGAYCAVDNSRGVWKAPANVALFGSVTPKYKVSDFEQGQYNKGMAINMIRQFTDSGVLIWGARTLQDSDDWRYVPVRRLFNSAEKDIKKAMAFAVFEPNSQPTWERVRSAVENYLRKLWQQGGLMGNSEKEAFYVQIGKGVTMTDDDIKQGKMIIKIGMAAVRPAEFIILSLSQDVGGDS
ncbi:phage tail sheath family protein [Pseudomonas sp. ITA]|uniref:phage tail sheath family protein n=1 Tax=Pseudomonas sp. ITA TaxID=2825841 RepID=UPI0024987438|nr:phage tail sheath C-terminal domain-containing protein [Pseudomonas sp. ITA]MDI2146122.1 phage tail sheath family protein [Pseudomonas sp. ITA]